MSMREEELMALADADAEAHRNETKRLAREESDKFINLFDKIFSDFQVSIDFAARNCRNNDASTALHEVSSAIDAMDIAFIIREALGVEHLTVLKKP